MLSFKSFLVEGRCKNDEDESEYEGLSELHSHLLHSTGDIDPILATHIMSHGDKNNINEDIILEATEETEANIKNAIKGALERHKKAYGTDIGKPLSSRKEGKEDEAGEVGKKAVREHFKKSEDEQKEALQGAAKRIGKVAWNNGTSTPEAVGKKLAGGNKKTDTVLNNHLAKTDEGKLTSHVSSYGGAPSSYEHYHGPEMKEKTHVSTCLHGTKGCKSGGEEYNETTKKGVKKCTKVGPACLAKSGGYLFPGTRKKVQINSHIRSGSKTVPDHAILTANHIVKTSEKAGKLGTVHAIRSQTTDERGNDIRNIVNETAKHHPHVYKNSLMFGYSKDPKEVLEAARRTKDNKEKKSRGEQPESVDEYISHSHPGPAIHQDPNGKMHLNPSNIEKLKELRQAHKTAKREGLVTNDYMVAGGHSMDKEGNVLHNQYHRQPDRTNESAPEHKKAKAKEEKERFKNLDTSIKKVRYWDLHHSGELEPHEKSEHHNPSTGEGHATIDQDGKRLKVKYYDREANVGDTESGRTTPEERHDARYSAAENKKPGVQVTAPVASTGNKPASGSYKNSLVHQVHVSHDINGNKFRTGTSEAGMFHDAHPDLMQKAGYKYKDEKETYRPKIKMAS